MSAVTPLAFAALVAGSLIGATLRWLAQIVLNPIVAVLPLGTLVVNVVGGLLIGAAAAWFQAVPDLSPAWRVFVFTGVLGGLTTFSSFTVESMGLLQAGRPGWAFVHAAAHLLGALAACFAGYALVREFS